MKFLLPIFALFLFLSGCKNCDHEQSLCHGLSSPYKESLSIQVGDTIKFKSDVGKEMKFIIDYVDITGPSTEDCFKSGYASDCACDFCPTAHGVYSTILHADSSWGDYGYLTYNVEEYQSDHVLINIGAGNSVRFELNPLKLLVPGQSYLEKHSTPFSIYDNVVHQTIDTNERENITPKQSYVSEVYAQIHIGVVAFRERVSGDMYYRIQE